MNNEAQIEYWNGPAGQKWVDQSARLDAMLAQYAEKVLQAANISGDERALDIGCGAGSLTIAASSQGNPEIGAVGVDVSTLLLELAEARAVATGSSATFECSDASQFTGDAPFDLVISRFGVMFFQEPVAAFANIRAQIRPGGRMAFMCWRALTENDWAFAPLQAALLLLNEAPEPGDPDAPGPFAFADKDRVSRILDHSGWENVSIEPFSPTIQLPGNDLESSTKFMLQLGPLSRLIASQGLAPEPIEAALNERLKASMTEAGRIEMKSACWLVTAMA
jgi:2-polyprenyl-3-methyl-5-hydroxy-6-metoxy-1,4-benzoquinol methylase